MIATALIVLALATPAIEAPADVHTRSLPPGDDAVLLARRPHTAFVLPLRSILPGATGVRATLVEIYPPGDHEDEVRRDNEMELDCKARRIRGLGETREYGDGRREPVDEPPTPWQPIDKSFPPFVRMQAIVCGTGETRTGRLVDWQKRIPQVRRLLDPD